MFSFEGQTRSRPAINLGGRGDQSSNSSGSSTTQAGSGNVAQRARLERQQREQLRQLDRHARVIQAFYRSRKEAGRVRDGQRTEYDSLIGALSTASKPIDDASIAVQATARLAYSFRAGNKADSDRLGRWARTMAVGKPSIGLWQVFDALSQKGSQEDTKRWTLALRRIARHICTIASEQPG